MVLCIEDEPMVLTTRKLLLQSAGYDVVVAQSAQQGLELFSTVDIDAVVVADVLAHLEGGAVAAHMKRLKPRIPIMMISSKLFAPDDTRDAVDAFVTSSEGPEELLTKLASLLRN
jgi:two-component system KDP operon response regulator KdpE